MKSVTKKQQLSNKLFSIYFTRNIKNFSEIFFLKLNQLERGLQ